MCIAIYKPENVEIPKETLETCFENNPDGAGYMFAEDKKLHVRKGFFDMDKFWNSYKRNKNKQNSYYKPKIPYSVNNKSFYCCSIS